MNEKLAILTDVLKRNGYSVTKPRCRVFEMLVDAEPQSMHDIYVKVAGSVDRVSLYRIIRLFEEIGVAQRIYVGWKYKLELTDIFSHHHHHISCISCHKLIVIKEDAEIEKLIHEIANRYNVIATNHQLEVQGYCADCKQSL